MPTLSDEVVGRAYTSTFVWETLERIVDVPERMAGSEGEAEGARVVEDAFRDAGFREVAVDAFDIHGWRRGSTTLSLPAPHDRTFDSAHEIVALPRTTDGTASGDLVDVGYGLPADFDGADLEGEIALASSLTPDDHDRFVHRREKYCRAIDAGAVGFLFYNHVDGCLPPTGSVGSSGPEEVPGEIPAAGVSKELGERLIRYCERGDVTAELDIECTNEPMTSRNVEGAVGPDTDREVLVSAHVDAHDICEGAYDNAAGCALVAEVGRLLSMEDDLDTGVRLVVFGSEEIGSLGAERWAETRDLDDVKCIVNLDAAGSTRTLEAATYGFPGLTAAFEETAEELDVPVEIDREVRGHTDTWRFVMRGVPGAYGSSYTGAGDRGWGHTHADTLDKLDVRDLRELAAVVATAVAKLAEADRAVEHKTVEEVRGSIDPGNEVEMRLLERYP